MKPCDVKPGLRVTYCDGVEEDTGTIVQWDFAAITSVWCERDRSVWVRWDSDAMVRWADLSDLELLESSCDDTPSTTRELTEEECVMFLLNRGYMIKGPGPTC